MTTPGTLVQLAEERLGLLWRGKPLRVMGHESTILPATKFALRKGRTNALRPLLVSRAKSLPSPKSSAPRNRVLALSVGVLTACNKTGPLVGLRLLMS